MRGRGRQCLGEAELLEHLSEDRGCDFQARQGLARSRNLLTSLAAITDEAPCQSAPQQTTSTARDRRQMSNILYTRRVAAERRHDPTAGLGIAAHARRTEIGLTRQSLARLIGVSLATLNAMETAAIHNLSINEASAVLEALGLSLEIASNENPRRKAPPSRAPLERAVSAANMSFGRSLTSQQLRDALLQGEVPTQIQPHLHVLLDEAPMSLLGKVVDQLHDEAGIERRAAWAHMRSLARQLKSYRSVWA